MITVEPYDDHYSTVEINILPVVYEGILTKRMGLKVYPLFNYQINPEINNSISHTGAGLSLPVYFKEREEILPYSGLFMGPHLGYTYNQTDMNNSLTYSADFGWNFLLKEKFAFIIDMQYGRTIIYNKTAGINVPHLGVFAQFGIWL